MRALTIISISIFFSVTLFASLKSNVKSTVKGIDIPNTHKIAKNGNGYILRGMAPINNQHYEQLINFGVKNILVFKKESNQEIDQEQSKLYSLGFINSDQSNFNRISFRWKDFYNFEVPCLKTIKALNIIKQAYKKQESLFFHCTVGEDRTGYLAALFTLLLNPTLDINSVFQNEMCNRAYGKGNKKKPYKVVKSIRDDLTPIFVKMTFLIKYGYISLDNLNVNSCKFDFVNNEKFSGSSFFKVENFYCE